MLYYIRFFFVCFVLWECVPTHDYQVLATSFTTHEGVCVSFHCNIIKKCFIHKVTGVVTFFISSSCAKRVLRGGHSALAAGKYSQVNLINSDYFNQNINVYYSGTKSRWGDFLLRHAIYRSSSRTLLQKTVCCSFTDRSLEYCRCSWLRLIKRSLVLFSFT